MGNRIYFDESVTAANTASGDADTKKGFKDYLGKVAQVVPIEIVAAYQLMIGFVPGIRPETWHDAAYWICFVVAAIFTGLYVSWWMEGYEKRRHIPVYIGSFVVWAYAISGDRLLGEPWHQESIAGIVLIIASLVLGLIKLPKIPTKPQESS